MKKRIILGIAACALWVLCVCLLTTQVQASQTEDFTYEVHDGKATITGCTWEYNYVIEIPQTVDGYPVVSIGAQAFEDYTYVAEVIIPEGVETIEAFAFYQCYNLQTLELPNSLTTIGEKAFCNCRLLEEITWGGGIKAIGDGAFSFCSKLDFYLDLPEGLETIGMGAFYGCNSLKTVLLPDSLKDLGAKSFAMCRSLDYIYIPDDIPKIGAQLLYGSACYGDSRNWYGEAFYIGPYLLEAMNTISGSYTPLKGITNIADGAFENCNDLTEVILPDSLRIIGASAFEDCDGLQSIVIPTGVTTIGDKAFYDCKGMTQIRIPDTVTNLGQDVFTKTGYYNDPQNWENDAFYVGQHLVSCKNTLSGTLEVRRGTKTIVNGAMKGLKKLTALILPDSLTTIGKEAAADCTALKTVHLGAQLSQIGDGAFSRCPSLEGITVDSNNKTYCSRDNCLIRGDTLVLGCKNSKLPSDGSVTQIGPYAFEGCAGLTQVTIPDTVRIIGEGAFRDCNGLTKVSLGNGVQIVGKRAFEECDILSQIDLGQSLHTIEDYGFAYNNRLKAVVFPASLQHLGREAFSNAIDMTAVTFREGLLRIGENCFIFCENLRSVDLPDSLEEIKDGAFYGCEKLESLDLGEGVVSIGDAAFDGCKALTGLHCPDSLQTIGDSAFYECKSLRVLELGRVKAIGKSAFEACESLEQIHIPASVNTIGLAAFAYCPAAESMTVSADNPYYLGKGDCIIHKAGKYLAFGCKNSVIPTDGSVSAINGYAFAGATGLKRIKVPTNVTWIGAGAFIGCSSLAEIELPFIGDQADSYYGYLGYIFNDTQLSRDVPAALKRVVILGGTNVGTSAFEDCRYLREIVLPETINWIGYSAFADCSSLEKVVLPGNVETVKDANLFSSAPKAFLYISLGQEKTIHYAKNNNIRHYIGGFITFNDANGQCLERKWYPANGQIQAPELPDAEAFWSPAPGRCAGNQTFRLRYEAEENTKPQGDLNGDAQIDNRDVEYLLWHTLFPESYPAAQGADFNKDGVTDNRDVEYLLWHTLFPENYPI